jgi:hypothetical protein
LLVDFRAVNAVTPVKGGRIPLIVEMLEALQGAKYFTSLDLQSGYWQRALDPRVREKTAFLTHDYLFEFRVLPFGLKNGPFFFQMAMDKVLAGLQPHQAHVHLDDIVVHSENFVQHIADMREILDRLREMKLLVKLQKGTSCVPENFLPWS